jgi:hypothetical protein
LEYRGKGSLRDLIKKILRGILNWDIDPISNPMSERKKRVG